MRAEIGLIGDARLTLESLCAEVEQLIKKPRPWSVTDEIAQVRKAWLDEWMPKLTLK